MSRQITKALASRETDQARLPLPLPFKKCILLYSSSIDGLRHGAKLEIKKKVVHIESTHRQIMHVVLLKNLVTIMESSTTHPSNKTKHPGIL